MRTIIDNTINILIVTKKAIKAGGKIAMKKLILGVVLLSLVSGIMAQSLVPGSPLVINMDYAKFHNDEQSGYLEVYYGFYPHLLTYNYLDNNYQGGIKLWTKIQNNQTNAIVVDEHVLLPVMIKDTSDVAYRFPFITQAGYALPFGEYTLAVTVADSIDPSRQDSSSFTVQVDPYADNVACSDLELCSKIVSSSNETNPFYKNSLEVVPNPTLIFGVTAYPVAFHYLELYNLNPEVTYTAKIIILDSNGNVVKETSQQKNYGVQNAVELGTTNMTSFASGKYQFQFLLNDENSNESVKKDKMFFIYNPHIVVTQQPVVSYNTSIYEGLSEKELDEEFDKAKYVATDEEMRMYKEIDTVEGKKEFLVNFWTRVEKGRMELTPIKRMGYLQRIQEADRTYRYMGKEGWETDMARVYVLYGRPDYIERNPLMEESKPWEKWHYYQIEGGVEFIFIDRRAAGYELVHSTKRGELYDANWEDYLR